MSPPTNSKKSTDDQLSASTLANPGRRSRVQAIEEATLRYGRLRCAERGHIGHREARDRPSTRGADVILLPLCFAGLAAFVLFWVVDELVYAVKTRRERHAAAALDRHVHEALAAVEPVPGCDCGECDG